MGPKIKLTKNVFLKYGPKKIGRTQNMVLVKNLQFWSNQADILAILPTHEVVILAKFHNNRGKIVDFLLTASFWASLIFFGSYFSY